MKNIIIRPIVTEKTNLVADDLNQYTFEVLKGANKIEIKKAIEEQYGVTVEAVNTSIRPGKPKSRVVKGRQTKGRTTPIKKAVVTVAEGQIIEEFFGNAEFDDVELVGEDDEINA